ncbi:MAG: methionine synthase [Desulfitobacteriaceae bacterium]
MKNMKFQPQFLTTAVGSLPHVNLEQALELIWRGVPGIPHWPQLPKTGAESSFIGQYLRALIETGVVADYQQPRFQVEAPDWMERMTAFYELYLSVSEGDESALERFGFTPEGGRGFEEFCRDLEKNGTREALFLKGQLSGPLTLGLQITDKNRRSCYYDETQRDMLVKSITMHARWQTKRLRRFGLPVLMTIDEPGLYAVGASTHVTLEKGQLVADLDVIAEGIVLQGGIPGAHVCAGMDWTILFDSQIQVVNFDAYEYMTSMIVLAEELNHFLERGGILSWGIVPTQQVVWEESVGSLRQRLEENIQELVKRGVDETRLRRQSMLTPSCGTGTLDLETAIRIYSLLEELGKEFTKELPVFSN